MELIRLLSDQLLKKNRIGVDVFLRGKPEGIRSIHSLNYYASLYDILKSLPDADVDFEVTDNHWIKIVSGKSNTVTTSNNSGIIGENQVINTSHNKQGLVAYLHNRCHNFLQDEIISPCFTF